MREQINEIIRGCISNSDAELTEELSLTTSGVINSLEFISVVAAIEEKWDIEISDRAMEGFRTLGDVYRYVESVIPAAAR